MTNPNTRRGFLRGLTALPLIGGGVTLIGNPAAAAEPITHDLLENYDTRLEYERRYLQWERYSNVPGVRVEAPMAWEKTGQRFDYIHVANHAGQYHGNGEAPASSRAALVLSAVGCGWGSTL